MMILANARLVLETEVVLGRVTVEQGRIAEIVRGDEVPDGAVDCAGQTLIPGMVELHTDNLERHLQPRPGVHWPQKAALLAHDAELASAGITTVFDALRVGSVISDSKSGFAEYARSVADELIAMRDAQALKINHLIHLRAEICSETLIEELEKFSLDDGIGIVSLMDHTPGQRQFRDIGKLRDYLLGKRGLSEAEFQAHVERLTALHRKVGAAHEMAVVAAARRYNAALASHDDTTPEQVAQSKAHGVSFAEFPTTVEAAAACRAAQIHVMMGAPNLIRGGSHSGNVAASELAKLDLLDILSSDYVPSSLLNGALVLAELWGDLPRAIQTVTARPAAAAGLTDRGRIAFGQRADLVCFTQVQGAAALRGVWVGGARVS